MSCELQNVYDICVLQNQTFELPLTLLDDDGLTPINITGWAFTGSIKQTYADTVPLVYFTASIVSVPSASIKLYLPAESTWGLDTKKYVYDVIANNPSGSMGVETLRLMQGKVSVNLGVTEP